MNLILYYLKTLYIYVYIKGNITRYKSKWKEIEKVKDRKIWIKCSQWVKTAGYKFIIIYIGAEQN